MTQFQTDFPYYGFINAELVEWRLTEDGHLTVWAMGEGPHIYVRKDKWQYKRFLFGSGNIIFTVAFKGQDYTFKLGLTPMREHKANEANFLQNEMGHLISLPVILVPSLRA